MRRLLILLVVCAVLVVSYFSSVQVANARPYCPHYDYYTHHGLYKYDYFFDKNGTDYHIHYYEKKKRTYGSDNYHYLYTVKRYCYPISIA